MKMHSKILGITLLLAIWGSTAFAQNTETRNLSSFSRVSIGISGDVELREGNQSSIKIQATGVDLSEIETEVLGNKLRIRWKRGYRNWRRRARVKVWLTYKSLNEVGIAGSADVIAKSVIRGNDLYLKISGSGNFEGQIAVKNLETKISGSGRLNISGNTNSQMIGISGSGSVRAYELKSNSAEVRISGSGSARLSVKNALTARISGSGSVRYKGNPPRIISKSSGSGSVRSVN